MPPHSRHDPLNPWQSFERLEFLGDSVLGLACRTLLMRRCPGSNEVRAPGACAVAQALWRLLCCGTPLSSVTCRRICLFCLRPPLFILPACVHAGPRPRPCPCLLRLLPPQGDMTSLASMLVSGSSNARYGSWLGLDRYLQLELRCHRWVGALLCVSAAPGFVSQRVQRSQRGCARTKHAPHAARRAAGKACSTRRPSWLTAWRRCWAHVSVFGGGE